MRNCAVGQMTTATPSARQADEHSPANCYNNNNNNNKDDNNNNNNNNNNDNNSNNNNNHNNNSNNDNNDDDREQNRYACLGGLHRPQTNGPTRCGNSALACPH